MNEKFFAIDRIDSIRRSAVDGNGLDPDSNEVKYIDARRDFAVETEKHGALIPPAEAVKHIARIAEELGLNPEMVALSVRWDEAILHTSFVPSIERSTYHNPNHERMPRLFDGLPRWKRLTIKREKRLDKAFSRFQELYWEDIVDLPYDKAFPDADTIIDWIRGVAEEFDVSPGYLMRDLKSRFFHEWDLVYDRKSYIYHGLPEYFHKEQKYEPGKVQALVYR